MTKQRSYVQSDVPMPSGWNRCATCGVQYAVPGAHVCDPKVIKPFSQTVPGRVSLTIRGRQA